MKALDLVGGVYGRLTVLCRIGSKAGASLWQCRCECGALTETIGERLTAGKTRSCGCLRADTMQATARTHGLSGTAEHTVWKTMHIRCGDPNHQAYAYYGGRGIRVCAEWTGDEGFAAFISHMGPRPTPKHTIDRIDPDRGYEPGNCRWATWNEQALNRRPRTLEREAA